MSVETSAVQISINVVDANSAAATAAVEENIKKIGGAGTATGQKVKQGFDQVGAGALSAREKTRLLTEEFGIRIPRAMQTLISQSAVAQRAMSAIGSAMIGIAAIQIGGMFFEAAIHGAEKLWTALTALPKSVQDYQAEVEKTRDQNFGDTHSIETTRARIDEATAAAERYEQQIRNIEQKGPQSWSWRATVPFIGAQWQAGHEKGEAATQQITWQKKLDQLQHVAEAQQAHEQRLSDIDLKYAGNVGLSGKAKHDAAIAEAIDRAHEERFYGNEQDKILGNSAPGNAGADKESREIAIARKKADAELANQERGHSSDAKSQAQELARIHEQADESELSGMKLLNAQRLYALKELENKGIATAAAINDVNRKFHNEEMNRLRTQEAEIDHMRQETQLMGLTGTARIKQEGENRIKNLSPNLNPGERLAAEHEIGLQTDKQVYEQDKKDADELAAKHTRSLEETERIEAQTRVRYLSAEKQKTAAIQAELEEKLQHYKEELAGQTDADEQYNRRAAAAQAEANAEIVEANKEARKKMAGEFTSFFKGMEHPGKYFAELGDKAAGNAAASLVQHFQGKKGGAGADAKGPDGIFGDVLGGFGFGKKKSLGAGADAKAEMPGAHGGAPMASASISIASAMIHVGSLSIAGGAGIAPGAPGTSFGGGEYTPGGVGTTLLAPGGTGASGGLGTGSTSAGSSYSSTGGAGFGAGASSPSATAVSRFNHDISDARQGITYAKKAASFFGDSSESKKGSGSVSDQDAGYAETNNPGMSGQFDKNGNFISSGSTAGNGSMTSSGFTSGNVGGAISGGIGLYSAYEGKGGVGGAAQGALSGAELGMAVAGPMGAAVGAVAGAAIGFVGHGGREEASKYNFKTVKPRIADDQKAYNEGSMNYLSAYADLESLKAEAMKTTSAMGPSARAYRNDTIDPEIKQAEGKLTAEEKAGRSQYSASAASYATGTPYVSETGYNLNHAGERIFSSVDNSEITKAVTEGNRGTTPIQAPSMGDVYLHVHAIDAKGVAGFLDKYKHNLRAAVNDSYAENSGGGIN